VKRICVGGKDFGSFCVDHNAIIEANLAFTFARGKCVPFPCLRTPMCSVQLLMMIQQPQRAPACPVVWLSEELPRPRSSSPACTCTPAAHTR